MEAHIHADMIGKRIPGLHLHNFSRPYDRHGGWDWGEDILKVGTTLAAGTPGLLVNGTIRTFDIAAMDSLIVAIPDSSAAHPVLRVWAYGWRAGLPSKVDFHWTLSTRLEDRHMQGEVKVSPAAGAVIALGVIKAPSAFLRRDSARAQLAMTGLPTYFNDSALLALRSAPAWFRGFFDQEGSVGLRLVPDAAGVVRWTQGGSWIQEPAPVWRQAGWESSWLPEPGQAGVAVRDARDGHGARDGGKYDVGGGGEVAGSVATVRNPAAGRIHRLRRIDGRLVSEFRPQ